MKKLLFITLFMCVSSFAKAQIAYTPFFGEERQGHDNQQQTEKNRITAYCVDFSGNCTKVPIIVTTTMDGYKVKDEVTSYCNDYGTWISCRSALQKCNSGFGSNEMEKLFTFRASLPIGVVYFDL